jgi:hypothetical protein
MKRIIVALFLLLLIFIGATFGINKELPPLHDGDLVFQTSRDPQATAILAATTSLFSHVGIVEKTPEGDKVIEAASVVRENPLSRWIKQGVAERMAIYRYKTLTDAQGHQIVAAATHYDGTPYDPFFSWKSTGMYCSKLPYLAYKQAGLEAGTLQNFSDLHMDNFLVRDLIEKRRRQFPDCADKDFAGCYDYILHQPVITPASIAADAHFEKIYSNYTPF